MTGPTPDVSITRLINDKGAVCLDGTPPAYYLDQGDGDGINNWVIYLQGGGWCSTVEECVDRSQRYFGSSKNLNESVQFGNILSKDSKKNPDFCNWNRVFIHYCDGSSYTGDVGTVDPGSGKMLPSSCTDKFIKPSLCFFPQYIVSNIKTPLFITMSSFDQIQAKYNLSPEHEVCLVYQNCTLVEANDIEALRLEFLDTLPKGNPSSRGIWVTSCIGHDLIEGGWIAPKSNTINGNKAYSEVFGDWFYDRRAINIIDISNVSKNCTDSGIQILPIW
nr:pectin acetylesterase 8-like isoform X3 [Ipomoea trifida]